MQVKHNISTVVSGADAHLLMLKLVFNFAYFSLDLPPDFDDSSFSAMRSVGNSTRT